MLCLLGSADAAAQQGEQLRGRVVDAVTGFPIAGAVVRIPVLERYTITNEDGWFGMGGLEKRRYGLEVAQLGYSLATPWARLPQADPLTILLTPQPIELEAVRAYNHKLDRDAKRHAFGRGRFYRVFDREDILATGADNGVEFLRQGPRMPIVVCDMNDPLELLCTRRPFHGVAGVLAALPLFTGRTRVSAGASGAQAEALGRSNRIAAIKGLAFPTVYVDDYLVPGGIAALKDVSLGDVHRVETYGMRGETEIRFYTAGYLELLATGATRPVFTLPPRYQYHPPTVLPDTVR